MSIEQYIQHQMKKQNIPGLAIGIIRKNSLIYGRGFGFANVEHQIPVKLETMFQSGSIGKQFISMAVMMLIERGDLNLTTRIKDHFEYTPKEWNRITVQHLLTHTSGMTDYPDDFDYRQDMTEDDMLDLIKKTALDFKPGEDYLYSNFGYIILGVLIRQITGKFYGDFLKEKIFERLDMKTARIISESDIIPNRASGYRLDDGEIKNQEWISPSLNTFADGALYLSINDMIRWELALNTTLLLKDHHSFKRMWKPVELNDGSTYPYGFGWSIGKTVDGLQVVYHGGAWQGFETFIIRVVEQKLTVVVFANLDEADVEKIGIKVLSIYDPKLIIDDEESE